MRGQQQETFGGSGVKLQQYKELAGQVVTPSQSDSKMAAGAMLPKLSEPDIND